MATNLVFILVNRKSKITIKFLVKQTNAIIIILSEQGNKHLIGPNPIRQPGEWEPYKGSYALATSLNLHLFATL